MNHTIHQTNYNVGDLTSPIEDLKKSLTKPGLHLYGELFLTGYPLQDLCLQKSFIDSYQKYFNELTQYLMSLNANDTIHALCGGLHYELSDKGQPVTIRNVIYHLTPGKKPRAVYTKRLLPSYDIFDEAKYFIKGKESVVIEISGKKYGLMICEDMWPSNIYEIDPTVELKKYADEKKIKLDAVINLSASPYNLRKHQKRLDRANTISKIFDCPFIYVNRVGGEDEILFDGQSFMMTPNGPVAELAKFQKQSLAVNLDHAPTAVDLSFKNSGKVNTWEDLLNANLIAKNNTLEIQHLKDEDCQELIEAITFGLQEYAKKSGFKKFLVALSGGMDSALVLTLAKFSLQAGQEIEAVYMPSQYSASLSYELSAKLCQNLAIPLKSFPIKFLHSTMRNSFLEQFGGPLQGLADENVQSRLRGMIIYTRSNATGAMVINTSNKSELAVGYSTQYGDSVGAISLLGDLYKTEVFQLANYINSKFGEIIPQALIDRPPTAELREGQKDTDSLPAYNVLDAILEGVLSYQYSRQDLMNHGFSTEVIEKVFNLYRKSEYKRSQFCPIIKVKGKSFGFGYRIPISKDSKFYIE